ncbi:TetR/AcrR family transcriptional regulator [Kitasatospora sp. GAS204B]|uniref:TetR/AcrR family transcriptional regulator n=1 Tax=unclassified Kitasatospora TaxID=2633591 RepID=UPI0024741E4A|nr:TetR/AcrR family transcriptional regulator [Kitasatospora sp. GAS204B]MDH6118029.1 AcrR family transcriptional regulator [Kitasatospora sp. GAS204B]
MGNREDLLTGAVQCLKDKGWSRTTVRDIAAAAGVNHAAIGYHFGSRDALLTAAFVQAMDEWGERIGEAVAASLDPQATRQQQYEALWREMIKSFTADRSLWLASLEAVVLVEQNPKLGELLTAAHREGRRGMAALLSGVPEDEVDEATERSLGGVQTALLSGVMTQWLLDPEHAPTEHDVIAGLRALGTRVEPEAPHDAGSGGSEVV